MHDAARLKTSDKYEEQGDERGGEHIVDSKARRG
jgi:hypothetical protein